MKRAYFYCVILVVLCITTAISTQESITNLYSNRQVLAQEIQTLFNHAKQDLDALFKHQVTTLEEFPVQAQNFQELFEYLSTTAPHQFTTAADTIITVFSTTAKNLPLPTTRARELTQQITELVNTLTTYKETLKDKLYVLIDTFIEKTDLAQKALQENLGTLTITFEHELRDITEEKESALTEIKNFLTTSINEFIHQATHGVIEKSADSIFESIKAGPNK